MPEPVCTNCGKQIFNIGHDDLCHDCLEAKRFADKIQAMIERTYKVDEAVHHIVREGNLYADGNENKPLPLPDFVRILLFWVREGK